MKYIALQSTYHEIQFGLIENSIIKATETCSKHAATEQFMLTINNLLTERNLTLKDISFITVNQGPGPFTTLRVVAASINGLAYATRIPLVGINTFEAMDYEISKNKHINQKYDTNVILLNAFGNDLYYSIIKNNIILKMGAQPIESILKQLAHEEPTQFLGNGIMLCKKTIQTYYKAQAFFPDPMPEYSSLQSVADLGLQYYNKNKNVNTELMPLYIKKHPVQQ